MADETRDAEAEYVRELRQKTTDLRRRANVEAVEQEYFSALVGLNQEVIKQKKILTDLSKQQRTTNQQFSIVNSILSNTRSELLKSVTNYRLNSIRSIQNIQVKEQEIAVIRQQIKVAEAKIKSDSEQISHLQKLKDQQLKLHVGVGQELISSEENRRILETQIQARQAVVDSLHTEITNSSALKDAADARLETLTDTNKSLREELTASQSVLVELNRRVASGEELTSEENAKRSELISEIARLVPLVNASNATVATEQAVRDDLIATIGVQQRELDQASSQVSMLTNQLTEVTDATDELKKQFNTTTSKLGKLDGEINNLGKTVTTANTELNEFNKTLDDKTKELKLLELDKLATKLGDLSQIIEAVTTPVGDLIKSVRDTQQRFGVVASQAAAIGIENLQASAKTFAEALTGGGPGVSVEQIAQAQADFQEQFGGIITGEAAAELAQQAVSMGVTTKQLAEARRVFMTQTGNDGIRAAGQVDKFITEFKKKGLTAQDAMEAIQKNSELLARNGARFATAFTRAAADAKKIGIDLGKVSQIGDNIIDDFEGFLESQATLGAMGFGFDSSRLAQIAATGDDTALFNELRSQLAATGKDITKLTRPERLELEKAFGINISDMLKLGGKTPEGGGEPTKEIQVQTNDNITKIFNATEAANEIAKITNTLLEKANGILSLIATNTAVSGLSGALGARGALNAAAKAIPRIGGTLAAGVTGTGAASIGTIAGVGVGGLAAGLYAGDKIFNTSVTEAGGGGTVTEAFKYGIFGTNKTEEEKEADRKNDEWARSRGFKSMADYLASKRKITGDDTVSRPGYGKRSLLTPSGIIALNDKDNIIAYADDFDGTNTLPKGSIIEQTKNNPAITNILQKLIVEMLTSPITGEAYLQTIRQTVKPADDYISYADDYIGGKNLPLGTISNLMNSKDVKAPTVRPDIIKAPTSPNLSIILSTPPITTTPSQQKQTEVKVDTTGIEQKLNNFINALQNIQINMDGAKVGKVLVNVSEAEVSAGVFRTQSR